MPSFSVRTVRSFAAGHQLRLPGGGLEPLHGHNWKVAVTVASDRLDGLGCVMDFHALERLVDAVVGPMHNRHLNELPPFDRELNPSTENVAVHVARSVGPGLPTGVRLAKVRVWETAGNSAEYRPDRPPPPTPRAGAAAITCVHCGEPAAIHLTEIKDGQKTERHLCEACAAEFELGSKGEHVPITELLSRWVSEPGRPPRDDPE